MDGWMDGWKALQKVKKDPMFDNIPFYPFSWQGDVIKTDPFFIVFIITQIKKRSLQNKSHNAPFQVTK